MPSIDENLKQFATDTQIRYIDAVNAAGTIRAAAVTLSMNESTIRRGLKSLQSRAAISGYSPAHDMTRVAPEPYVVRGVSTYYNAEGKASGQWVKTRLDDEKFRAVMQTAFEAMAEDLPRELPVAPPLDTQDSLCNLITMTDCHVGMLAWHKEGGNDWDITIAEQTLIGCFEHMVMAAPKAKMCFVNQLGDWMHSDGMLPVTPTNHHVLDQDSRFSKMVETAIRMLRRIIQIALSRHDEVVVLLAEGNHDPSSSIWLRAMFKALYENEPRIKVIDSPLPYYTYQHGKTMLAFHHGHMSKNDSLPLLFASQFPVIWGNTTKRYAHTGHRHHVEEKEHSGMTVIQHATLAARDAYAARGGWISERQAQCITYHSEFGQVARNTVTPEMIAH